MKLNAAMILAAAVILAASAAMAETQWQQVRSIGQRHFVVVNPANARDTDLLRRAATAVCPGKQACFVIYWSDAASVPRTMPMTRGQQQRVVAQYLRNPVTGKADLLLRCQNGNTGNAVCLH